MTNAQTEALKWLRAHGGDGCFDKNGIVLAQGELAPHTRKLWNSLRDLGLIEFYNLSGRGRGRIRIINK